ncbi:MAG: hypothetical protein QOD07_353 [Frankiaceae bacterium]|nr:hypothetical protein [Frankiaceae bacterium]
MAVAISILGVALTALGTKWLAISGAVVSALGGILLSTVVTRFYAAQGARSEVAAHVSGLNRQVGATALQLSELITQTELGNIDTETCNYMINQASRTLYGLAREIEQALGGGFESERLVESVSELAGLVDRVLQVTASASATPDAPVQTELAAVRESLAALQSRLTGPASRGPRQLLSEQVGCPFCGEQTATVLGDVPGDSSTPQCPACGQRFHAHRANGGTVFARQPGVGRTQLDRVDGIAPLHEAELPCPACDTAIPLRWSTGTTAARWCLKCYTRLVFDLGELKVLSATPDSPLEGQFPGSGGHTSIICPNDGVKSPTFSRVGNDRFAICTACRKLLVARDDV